MALPVCILEKSELYILDRNRTYINVCDEMKGDCQMKKKYAVLLTLCLCMTAVNGCSTFSGEALETASVESAKDVLSSTGDAESLKDAEFSKDAESSKDTKSSKDAESSKDAKFSEASEIFEIKEAQVNTNNENIKSDGNRESSEDNDKESETIHSMPSNILDSYYSAQSTPVFEYFQHRKIQKFLAMWVDAQTGNMDDMEWKFDNFTEYTVLNHEMEPIRPDQQLYCCTFSNGADQSGYVVFSYDEKGPSIQNYGVTETSPYLYDLKANAAAILRSLKETDLDLSTAEAARLSWFDEANKRSDQAILFTDAKGGSY